MTSKISNRMKDTVQSEELLSVIQQVVIELLQPKRIYLFGSRAIGKNKEYSDFDIAIEGSKASFRDIRKAKEKLDESLGIYSCDLVELEKTGEDFQVLVKEQGKLIYERD